MKKKSTGKTNLGGRPPKFDEPSRPVTLTLPESTLADLERIHPDRGRAIVKVTQNAMGGIKSELPLVDIVEVAANTGLLVVGPSKALRRIPFLHLVEVAPGRHLLALDPGNEFKALELAVRDVLDEVPKHDVFECELIEKLLRHIKDLRKSERISMAEILFVKLEK